MKSNKNAFTLIELLAIIVILAIIAVITVPIILNIIENSKKGAATDSAYGYKDSVNKAYIQELAKPNNGSLKLDGTYVVQSNGTLNADTGSNFGVTNYTNLPVSVSGDKPSSGKLRYSNNVLNAGCLVIGDYKVTFDGNTVTTVKGNCEDYEFPSENAVALPTMSEMCPGCVFGYDDANIGETLPSSYNISDINSFNIEDGAFMGLIVDSSTGKITRTFVCGAEKGKSFCLEGKTDASTYESNIDIINKFVGCGANISDSRIECSGTDAYIMLLPNGGISISVKPYPYNDCNFDSDDGYVYCH